MTMRSIFSYKPRPAQQGFSLVEIIVVLAVITTVFIGLLQLAVLEQQTQRVAAEESAAYILAREALEAARSIRDENWSDIANLAVATPYYPVIAANQWVLSTTNPGSVGIYNRWLSVDDVLRDASDNISITGSLDVDTRAFSSFVSWTDSRGAVRTIQLDTYLTNWQAYQ